MRALAAISLFALVACAPQPVSPDRAAELCRDEVRSADGVTGNIGVGVGNGGAKAKGSITVTDRVFNPQTEEEFMEACIARRVQGKPAPPRIGITIGGRT